MQELVFDAGKTTTAFEKYTNLSWSSYDNARTCEGLWFLRSFYKKPSYVETTPLKIENSRAVAGTIIQKLFEGFVNGRIYARPEYQGMPDLIKWCETNIEAIFYLTSFPVEKQFEKEFAYTKDYFQKANGLRKIKELRKTKNLDPFFTDINISYIDKKIFQSVHGSDEDFLRKVKGMIPDIIRLFAEQNIDLGCTVSELYERVPFDIFNLSGSIDFVSNPWGCRLGSIDKLEDGYTIFDGKYNLSAYVKEEQLNFYSFLLYTRTKKVPGRMFLMEYSKARVKDVPFSAEYFQTLTNTLAKIKESATRIKSVLRELDPKKAYNVFQPGFLSCSAEKNHCTYCTGVECCPEAEKKGIKVFSAGEQSLLKKETESDMLAKSLDPEKNTHDITL